MQKIKGIVFILLLGSISTILLLGIRAYTAPLVLRYEEIQLKTSILEAAGIAFTKDNIDQVFDGKIKKEENYYRTPDGFYVFEYKGRGLWGWITGVITLNPDLETIENIKIIAQEETPGLGARITEKKYLDQFKKKKIVPELVVVLRAKAEKENEVDAITGATMTSNAFVDTINKSCREFRERLRSKGR